MLIAQIFSICCESKGYPPHGHSVGVSVVLRFSEWATCQPLLELSVLGFVADVHVWVTAGAFQVVIEGANLE